MDFGGSEVKIVEGKSNKKGINISNYFTINIPTDLYRNGDIMDIEQLSYVLSEELKNYKFSTDTVNVVINSSKIITREITLPKVGHNEILSILEYQIGDFIPINPDDYIVKHIVLNTIFEDNLEKLNLMLIAIPKFMVESHLKLIKNIGLKPQVLDYQGNVTQKLLAYNDYINENIEIYNHTIGILDLGYNITNLTIINNKSIVLSRTLEIGTKNLIDGLMELLDLDEDRIRELLDDNGNISNILKDNEKEHKFNFTLKEHLQNLSERVDMVFRYYKNKVIGSDIDSLILIGGLSNIKNIETIFTSLLNNSSYKLNSLDKIKLNGELSKYFNAVGGLIRLDEVSKK